MLKRITSDAKCILRRRRKKGEKIARARPQQQILNDRRNSLVKFRASSFLKSGIFRRGGERAVRVSGVLVKRWLQVAYSYTHPIHRSVKFNQTRNTFPPRRPSVLSTHRRGVPSSEDARHCSAASSCFFLSSLRPPSTIGYKFQRRSRSAIHHPLEET